MQSVTRRPAGIAGERSDSGAAASTVAVRSAFRRFSTGGAIWVRLRGAENKVAYLRKTRQELARWLAALRPSPAHPVRPYTRPLRCARRTLANRFPAQWKSRFVE